MFRSRSRDPIHETEAVPIPEARMLRDRTTAAVFFVRIRSLR